LLVGIASHSAFAQGSMVAYNAAIDKARANKDAVTAKANTDYNAAILKAFYAFVTSKAGVAKAHATYKEAQDKAKADKETALSKANLDYIAAIQKAHYDYKR